MHIVMTVAQLVQALEALGKDIQQDSGCDPWLGVNPEGWVRQYIAHHPELIGERAPVY